MTVTPDPDNEPLTEERVRAIVRDEIHELIVAPVVNFANDMTTVISASAITDFVGHQAADPPGAPDSRQAM